MEPFAGWYISSGHCYGQCQVCFFFTPLLQQKHMDSIGRNGHQSDTFFRCEEEHFLSKSVSLSIGTFPWSCSISNRDDSDLSIFSWPAKEYAIPKSPNSLQRSGPKVPLRSPLSNKHRCKVALFSLLNTPWLTGNWDFCKSHYCICVSWLDLEKGNLANWSSSYIGGWCDGLWIHALKSLEFLEGEANIGDFNLVWSDLEVAEFLSRECHVCWYNDRCSRKPSCFAARILQNMFYINDQFNGMTYLLWSSCIFFLTSIFSMNHEFYLL